MINVENKVKNFIDKHRLLEDTSKVYVATSGGADSMALLAFMYKFKDELGIEVGAAHVNHGIRGETASRDENFVKDYCEANGIELVVFNAENDNVSVPENASEEWARQLRYNYFGSLVKRGVKIATAHTLSDQTETIIFRLARGGSGLRGLTGIPVKREGYIRPYLGLARKEIEDLVDYYGTGNITDETNLGDDYSRNKIRHYVVPVLKEINSEAEVSIGKVCERMTKAYNYIYKQAKMSLTCCEEMDGLKYSMDGFIGKDEIILDEMLIQLLDKIQSQNEHYVEKLKEYIYSVKADETDEVMVGELNISDTLSIMATNQYITVHERIQNNTTDLKIGNNTFGLYSYSLDVVELDQEGFKHSCKTKNDLCNYADLDRLDISKCVIRSKKDGDTFKPAQRVKNKLTRFMRNIPLAERNAVPVIEYSGEIIWVWGFGFTDGYTPTEDSREVYKFSWF